MLEKKYLSMSKLQKTCGLSAFQALKVFDFLEREKLIKKEKVISRFYDGEVTVFKKLNGEKNGE